MPKRLRVLAFSGAFVLTIVVFGLLVLSPEKPAPFVYFQF